MRLIGNERPPPVVYIQPMLIEPQQAPPPLIYLHVPPSHANNWRKHYHEYNACNRPVYFVRSQEYDSEYQRHYQDHERERELERQRWQERERDHDRGHWRGHDGASAATDLKVMTATTNDVVRSVRNLGASLLLALSLLLTPFIAAHAAEIKPHDSAISIHVRSFGAAVKRNTKAVGAGCKEGAHRIAVAAKAVAHEIATAAKRGAAGTQAAFRGEKAETPAS